MAPSMIGHERRQTIALCGCFYCATSMPAEGEQQVWVQVSLKDRFLPTDKKCSPTISQSCEQERRIR
jgi:hypothetical protein